MSKIVVSSDWHLDASTAGVRRFEEIRRAAWESVQKAVEEKASAYFFLGDLCDPDSGSSVFRCVETAMTLARLLAHHHIPSYWLAGNHDVIEDGTGDTTLSPLRGDPTGKITVIESPKTVWVLRENDSAIPAVFLPYTSTCNKVDLHEWLPEAFLDLNTTMPLKGRSIIVAGHLNVAGIVPGSETEDMPRGRDVWFPYEAVNDLLSEYEASGLLLNGHIHKAGAYYVGGKDNPPILIPGNLANLTFGEEDNNPGYIVVEVADTSCQW